MNKDIDITKNEILSTGALKKTGGQYALVLLTPDNIGQMLCLQNDIFAKLTKEQQTFLHHKDEKFLTEHFARGNIVLGLIHDRKLIGQSVIVNPTSAHPETGLTDTSLGKIPKRTTVIQGVIVHPDYRGNDLMSVMVDQWLATAKAEGRTQAYAEVTVQNMHSWSVFMKEGLKIVGIAHDDVDDSDVYNMHAPVTHLIKKRAKADFNKAAAKGAIPCPAVDFKRQQRMLAKGYQGVAFDPASKTIAFAPKRNLHAPRVPQ